MEKDSSLINYASLILSGLIIGYFLLITNPPPALLRYDENLQTATTYHLSGPEIINHISSIVPFIFMFFLISTFSAFIGRKICSKMRKLIDVFPIILLLIFSIFTLGAITYGYYGRELTAITVYGGLIGVTIGTMLLTPDWRRDFPYFFNICAFGVFLIMRALASYEPNELWSLSGYIMSLIFVASLILYAISFFRNRRGSRKKRNS